MTPAQFIDQLNELKRRGRPLFYVGAAAVLLVDLDIIFYALHLYPLQAHSPEAPAAYWIAFAACWLPIAVLYLALRITVNRYAPVCRTCGAKATWKLRSEILVTGHCPSCHAAFFVTLADPMIGSSTLPGRTSGS